MKENSKSTEYLLVCLSTMLGFGILGCSRSGGINIDLPNGTHLADHPSGFWLRDLLRSSSDTTRYITTRVHDVISAIGEPIDKYSTKRKSVTVVWKVTHGKKPYYADVYQACSHLIIEETLYDSDERGTDLWLTINLDEPGLPWSCLIPDQFMNLKPNRKYENAVAISSRADRGARLFLFGWGKYCKRISLF